MKKMLFVGVIIWQSALAGEIANKKELEWLMSMDATYSCTTVCINYRKFGRVDVNKMIEYGSLDNCGSTAQPVACYTVGDWNSVNIRHSLRQLVDRCDRNGFEGLVEGKTQCETVSTRQECSERPEDQSKPASLKCHDIINWRQILPSELVRTGLIEIGAKLVEFRQ